MANKTKKQKKVKTNFKRAGQKMALRKRKLKAVKKVAVETEDTYLNEDSRVVVENAFVVHPSTDEVGDELRDLAGFRDWEQEQRGNSLTYGDY